MHDEGLLCGHRDGGWDGWGRDGISTAGGAIEVAEGSHGESLPGPGVAWRFADCPGGSRGSPGVLWDAARGAAGF